MSLSVALNTVRNAIVANISGFTTDNCSIGDEAVFSYVETSPTAPDKCCIVEYNGFRLSGRPEFGAVTISWRILVNGFFMISDPDYTVALNNARDFVDSLVALPFSSPGSPLLDSSSIAAATPINGETLLVYKRGNYTYALVPITLEMLDNLS